MLFRSGVVPADVAEGSVYQPFAGALIYSIQCGPRLTTVRADAHEHWLVVLPPGAPEATIVSCADPRGDDMCVMPIPRAAAAATGTSSAPH